MNCKKHIKLTAISNVSWKDAIVHSIQDASQTLNHLVCVQVLDQRAKIQGDKIIEYYADLDLEFEIDKKMQELENTSIVDLDE